MIVIGMCLRSSMKVCFAARSPLMLLPGKDKSSRLRVDRSVTVFYFLNI